MFGCVRDLCVKERACLIACKGACVQKVHEEQSPRVHACPLKVCACV